MRCYPDGSMSFVRYFTNVALDGLDIFDLSVVHVDGGGILALAHTSHIGCSCRDCLGSEGLTFVFPSEDSVTARCISHV